MDCCVYCHYRMNQRIHQDHSIYQTTQIHRRCSRPFPLYTKWPRITKTKNTKFMKCMRTDRLNNYYKYRKIEITNPK